jgi:uncharacterized protein YuzB (UPF0349 family)
MAEAAAKPIPKVHICKKCSGIDGDELKTTTGINAKDLKVSCMRKCNQNKGKVFGLINGETVICDTKDDFIGKVKEAV